MPALRDILLLANYYVYEMEIPENELIAWTKILAYRGCFDKPPIDKKEGSHSERIKTLAIETTPIWKRAGLKEYYPLHHKNIISDKEAIHLLDDTLFDSYSIGFKWFRNVTQIHLFRQNYDEEILNHENDKSGHSPRRMLQQETITINETKKKDHQSINYQLYNLLTILHVIDRFPWPKDKKIENVVLFGHMDEFIRRCIKFMKNFSGKLYYLTGVRALFNREPALVPILLKWLGLPKMRENVKRMRKVLGKHQDLFDPLQWTGDLSGLKKEIMAEFGVTKWPNPIHCYYKKYKEIFDKASDELKQERLDCLGGPWPVSLDMVDYYLRLFEKTEVELVPVMGFGDFEKLVTIHQLFRKWYETYQLKNVLFIACNGLHRLPYVKTTLMDEKDYQDDLLKQTFQNNLNHFRDPKKPCEEFRLTLAGPSTKQKIYPDIAFDNFAKLIYTINFDKAFYKYQFYRKMQKDEVAMDSPAGYIERMIHFNEHIDYLRLAYSTYGLAKELCKRYDRDLIKGIGLFNFAVNVLKADKNNNFNQLIESLYECIYIKMQSFIIDSAEKLKIVPQQYDIHSLRTINLLNKNRLIEIRKFLFERFNELTDENDKRLYALYKTCLNERTKFFLSMVEQTNQIFGKSIFESVYIQFGSSARGQPTPFSDLEFGLLVGSNDETALDYFRRLSRLLLLLMVNLGEFYVPGLGIHIKDNHGKQHDFKHFYDWITHVGYCPDGMTVKASMNPEGMEESDGKGTDPLVGSPNTFAKKITESKGFQHIDYFPKCLRLSTPIIHPDTKEPALFAAYKQALSHDKSFNSYAYSFFLLKKYIRYFISDIDHALKLQHIKNEQPVYQTISVTIDNLFMLMNPMQNVCPQKKFNLLLKHGIINDEQKEILERILKKSLYLRFKSHYFYKRHEISISVNDPLFVEVRSAMHALRHLLICFDEKLLSNEVDHLKKEGALASSVVKSLIFERTKLFSKINNYPLVELIPDEKKFSFRASGLKSLC